MLFEKLVIIIFLFGIPTIFACHRSSKQSTSVRPANTTKSQTTTLKTRIVLNPSKNCTTFNNNSKQSENYCMHNSTCLYQNFRLNETHDQRIIFCQCKPVSYFICSFLKKNYFYTIE